MVQQYFAQYPRRQSQSARRARAPQYRQRLPSPNDIFVNTTKRPLWAALCAVAVVLLVSIVHSAPAHACSAHQGGDTLPQASTAGNLSNAVLGWLLTLETRYQSAERGRTGEDGWSWRDDRRLILGASYAWKSWLRVGVQWPLVWRNALYLSGEAQQGYGPGDVSAFATWSWSPPTLSHRIAFLTGLRLPSAVQIESSSGVALSDDVQPGAGVTAAQLGISDLWTMDSHFALEVQISALLTLPGGRFVEEPGSALLGSVVTRAAFFDGLLLTAAIDARWERPMTEADVEIPNTGGFALYLSPGLGWWWDNTLGLQAVVRLPVVKAFEGVQNESPIFSLNINGALAVTE